MIGGNIKAVLEIKIDGKNAIGEPTEDWKPYMTFEGFLDFMSGSADYANYNAKIQERTHVFISDYIFIDKEESECRLTVNGKHYEVTLFDDPMELHKQIEIYLKYVG